MYLFVATNVRGWVNSVVREVKINLSFWESKLQTSTNIIAIYTSVSKPNIHISAKFDNLKKI